MDEGFLKNKAAFFEGLLALADVLIIGLSFLLVHRITEGDLSFKLESVWIMQATILFTYVVFRIGGVYGVSRGRSGVEEIWRLFVSWTTVILFIGLFAFLTKTGEVVSRIWFGFSTLIAIFGMSGLRIVIRLVLTNLRSKGFNWQRIILVGDQQLAQGTVTRLNANQWTGLKIEGIFIDNELNEYDEHSSSTTMDGIPVLGSIEDMHAYIEKRRFEEQPVEQVWITLPLSAEIKTRDILSKLKDSSVDVCLVPDLFGMTLLRGAVDEIGGIPLISLSNVRISGLEPALKTFIDFVISVAAILLIWPILVVIAVLIKIDSKGPVIFSQNRYGIDGRVIKVYKFRTMQVAENNGVVRQATRNDPRVTAVGAKLRKWSLDELPQLFNVLFGSMSLVGPRPHAVEHNEEYRGQIEGYMMRHKMKPGITGWAQVNGWRGETETLDKMEKRVEYDLHYLQNWTIWLDFKILFLTVVRSFKMGDIY